MARGGKFLFFALVALSRFSDAKNKKKNFSCHRFRYAAVLALVAI